MVKAVVNPNQLATILDTKKSSIYYIMYPDKKKNVAIRKAKKENRNLDVKSKSLNLKYIKKNNNIYIDLDEFLNLSKISKSFKFQGDSFFDRMLVNIDIELYSDFITTKEVIELTNFTKYQVISLRNKIKTKKVLNEKYPIDSKGRFQYLYSKSSLINYLKSNNLHLNTNKILVVSKQFYSPKEVVTYLKKYLNIDRSLSTVYRRILVTKEIPAIRVGYMLKIPILEFKALDLENIFL